MPDSSVPSPKPLTSSPVQKTPLGGGRSPGHTSECGVSLEQAARAATSDGYRERLRRRSSTPLPGHQIAAWCARIHHRRPQRNTPAVSTDCRALASCCRHMASAATGRSCRRDESRPASCARAFDVVPRSWPTKTLARHPRASHGGNAFAFPEGFSAPVWTGVEPATVRLLA